MPQKLGLLQKEWVDALRSGKYKQGKYKLWNEEGNTFCCLGVCEAINDGFEKCVMARMYLSHDTVSLLKFYSDSGLLIGANWKEKRSLSEINDQTDTTFEEIANFVEEHPETIFSEEA